jgi:NAD(P)-dependent dehydrogenase (short-subunit alcohol dehydrogenase family)
VESSSDQAEAVQFDGQVAVVTGAGRGIGREVALLLAARGAAVVVNDIGVAADESRYGAQDRGAGVADSVVAEILNSSGRALANTDDVADPVGATRIVKNALSVFGRLDIVVNNAGVIVTGSVEELTLADVNRCFGVHVGGAFNMSRAAWPHFRSGGHGRILNMCSVEGMVFGNAAMLAYDTAKGAMGGLTRSLAAEGRAYGITANGMLPGASTRGLRSVLAGIPVPSEIDLSPSLVAPAACWLVSRECTASGRFYAAAAGRMGIVNTALSEGYQSARPADFSVEQVRDNWAAIESDAPALVPASAADFNAWRLEIFRRRAALPSTG